MVTRYLDHCCILPSLVLGFGGNKGSVLLRYVNNSITNPRGSIYTIYGIRPQKNHPCCGFGDLIP